MAKAFTLAQIEELKRNPYTYEVTKKKISFTKAFKEIFYQKYREGMYPKDIVASLGYDPEVLGYSRIKGINGMIQKSLKEHGCLYEGRLPRHRVLNDDDLELTKENFVRMQHEVQLLRQEMDFIKKISSIRDSGK
jgi:hypothetical protein